MDDLGMQPETDDFDTPTKILRPKVSQATRWGSTASMMRRLIVLKIPMDSWFVVHGDTLKPEDPDMLTPQEWRAIMDVSDVLGLVTPITRELEKAADPGIVYVLPTLLALLTKGLHKAPDTAISFSGRLKATIAISMGKDADTPSQECLSPL